MKEILKDLLEKDKSILANAKTEDAARIKAEALRLELVREEGQPTPEPAEEAGVAQCPKEFLQSIGLNKLSPSCPISKEISQQTNDDTYI